MFIKVKIIINTKETFCFAFTSYLRVPYLIYFPEIFGCQNSIVLSSLITVFHLSKTESKSRLFSVSTNKKFLINKAWKELLRKFDNKHINISSEDEDIIHLVNKEKALDKITCADFYWHLIETKNINQITLISGVKSFKTLKVPMKNHSIGSLNFHLLFSETQQIKPSNIKSSTE